jgi:hypothetical protein
VPASKNLHRSGHCAATFSMSDSADFGAVAVAGPLVNSRPMKSWIVQTLHKFKQIQATSDR